MSYKNAYNTVMNRVKDLENEGYIFNKSKLPKLRKTASTSGLEHLKQFTKAYLKKMPSTKFRISPTVVVSGAEGDKIQRSARGRKAARTRKYNEKHKSPSQKLKDSLEFQKSLLDTKYKDDDRFDGSSTLESTQSEFERISEELLQQAIEFQRSSDLYSVESDGTVIDNDIGEIVYEPVRQEQPRYIEQTDGSYVDIETGNVYANPYVDFMDETDFGMALVDGLETLIKDYQQSDNRWIRLKADELYNSFESANKETLADNLRNMSSDVITYVQQIVEESGGNQAEVNNNYAKITEIKALIEGRTLDMDSLRSYYVE